MSTLDTKTDESADTRGGDNPEGHGPGRRSGHAGTFIHDDARTFIHDDARLAGAIAWVNDAGDVDEHVYGVRVRARWRLGHCEC